MTHRVPGRHAVVLGQIAMPEGITETTQWHAAGPLDICGALVTADAAPICVETARYLVEDRHADYLLTIKGNRPSLHAAALAASRALPATEPGHVGAAMGGSTAGPPGPPTLANVSACRMPPGPPSSGTTPPTWPDAHTARKSPWSSPAAPA
ncbi:hypothetical protein [Actinomadura roseirufa]|uniref:hypothetical protein n=1 Tax=Actinomadura roseirufa TaxID=2094049 RepID=UPI001041549F|nr:hypothetical protein [Actinomadura roseirufa]